MKLTQSRLKELYSYNPDIGDFIRIKTIGGGGKAGSIAGYIVSGMGYRRIRIDRSAYYTHRLAFLYMTGHMPDDEVDHINHVRDDNRWSNIRQATRKQNTRNVKLKTTNKSGTTGVSWSKNKNRWIAQIQVAKKHVHLGYFKQLKDAVSAREQAIMANGFHTNHGK